MTSADIAVDFTVCPAQSRAYRKVKPRNRICNAWGRGTGKSTFARIVMYLLVAEWDHKLRPTIGDGKQQGVRIVLFMPTLKQFKKVHETGLENELARNGTWGMLGAKINHTDWKIEFPGGSWIQVVSAVNVNDNRGIRCDMLVADEVDDIEIGDYESVCTPWFSEPWSLDIRLLTGTPRRGRYGLLWKAFQVWPYGDGVKEPVANHYAFHATYKDAPRLVSHDMVEEAKRTTSPDRFAREWLCDFDSGEGLVYPFFDPKMHVRQPPGMYIFHTFIVGFDYGFADPAAFVVIGIAGGGKDAICHVVREDYVTGKSDTELARIALDIETGFPGAKWYSDHHPSTIQAFKNIAHVDVREADKAGAHNVENGVAFVADALFVRTDNDGKQWAQLYVDPSCVNLIQEFGLYRRKRDPRDKERVLDTIDSSKNDHALDAVRMALWTHFGGIERRLVVG